MIVHPDPRATSPGQTADGAPLFAANPVWEPRRLRPAARDRSLGPVLAVISAVLGLGFATGATWYVLQDNGGPPTIDTTGAPETEPAPPVVAALPPAPVAPPIATAEATPAMVPAAPSKPRRVASAPRPAAASVDSAAVDASLRAELPQAPLPYDQLQAETPQTAQPATETAPDVPPTGPGAGATSEG